MLATLSYTFAEPAGHGATHAYWLMVLFVVCVAVSGWMLKAHDSDLRAGALRFLLAVVFWAAVFAWGFHYQGGTRRFCEIEAGPTQIRLRFTDPQETLSFDRSEIASLSFGIDSPVRSQQTWCYLQLTTTSGKRYFSQNRAGDDCKRYRHEIANLMNLR